ncbi:MAG: DUF5658 family protein [Candidatus Parvarchaeota archaeon]|jgi:hypothetical protein|nr:DUF5658 family protein [Candidatus Parvarchaeota archaeon]MCW1294995.1 DUF5658 family protein [Candidatus Parvarchaeum tengchongense]MCW1295328.1 DUF5658 family protein [Candidatus Parvarchaeum tengchongense]MCW1299386.1 DUF5658 family protein [Candidatus Parvarchaeum tengchongense]MCW1312620.1 DUF5658 family protein [Candidatus Parvarchaeum tengchongense]
MGLDSIIEDENKEVYANKNLKYYLGKAFSGLKKFYKDNLAVKFKFLYESAAMFSDRILTYFGLEYQGGQEANPIMAKLFNYIGIIPSAISSYIIANVSMYIFSSKIHKKVGLKNKQMLGSVYLGMGGSESLVSLHNYLSMNNYNNIIANMSYAQSFIPLTIICVSPFLYYWGREYLHKKKVAKTNV